MGGVLWAKIWANHISDNSTTRNELIIAMKNNITDYASVEEPIRPPFDGKAWKTIWPPNVFLFAYPWVILGKFWMSIYSIYLDHFLYSCLYFKRLSELCSFETYMFSIKILAWNLSSYLARAFTFSRNLRLRYFW